MKFIIKVDMPDEMFESIVACNVNLQEKVERRIKKLLSDLMMEWVSIDVDSDEHTVCSADVAENQQS